jgi:hypothetical protein
MLQKALHKGFSILNSILRDGNKNATHAGSRPNVVPETGLEPVRMISPTVFKDNLKAGQKRASADLPLCDAQLDH